MKKILLTLISFLFLIGVAIADDVLLAWDANTEPDVAKYRIYETRIPGTNWEPVAEVSHPTTEVLLEGYAKDGKKYYWVATALDAVGNESSHSNMVNHTFAIPPDTTAPAPPAGLHKKTVIVQGQLTIHIFGDELDPDGGGPDKRYPWWRR